MTEINSVLEVHGLNKRFGRIQAVQNLHLSIQKGQVYGLLGPNGSGKTTTLGIILDVVSATSGHYQWFGGLDLEKSRQKIGAILETPCFLPYLSAVDNLKIVAHIKQSGNDNIDEVLKRVNLHSRRNDKFKTYSLGMKQRLSIAAALVADPPVLILDEPTNGLDPQGISEVRELIKSIASDGKTIIIASHLLDEVQKICSHFCVLKNGVKLHEGPVADILKETNQIEIATEDNAALKVSLETLPQISAIVDHGDFLVVSVSENVNATMINKLCFEKGFALKRLITRKNSLEQEFLKILKEND